MLKLITGNKINNRSERAPKFRPAGAARALFTAAAVIGILTLMSYCAYAFEYGSSKPFYNENLSMNIKSIDSSSFPVISIYAYVTDEDGAIYRNLNKNYFKVSENCIKIDHIKVETDPKVVNLVLALDISGSMKRMMRELKQDAFAFLSMLDKNDKCAILGFRQSIKLLQDFTGDQFKLNKALFSTNADCGTYLYDSLYKGIDMLHYRDGGKAILVISDGSDESPSGKKPYSKHTLDEVIDYARKCGVQIYTIGLGYEVLEEPLRELANKTGGVAQFSPNPYELKFNLKKVLQSFKTFYKIMYMSYNPELSQNQRAVEVEVKTPHGSAASTTSYSTMR
ncbi:MAG TPA: VWA domain-containing protein [Candidatus Wallbacteria bacterium]|nr:VWA domain-containing protein [Candidatus Wallbacteria bacterium]